MDDKWERILERSVGRLIAEASWH